MSEPAEPPRGRGLRRKPVPRRASRQRRPAAGGPAAEESAERGPWRRSPGWQVIAAKELSDHLLSVRFLVLVIVLGLAGAGAIYAAASEIRNVAANVTAEPALFLRVFTVAPSELRDDAPQIPAFYALIGFLGPLLGIAFGFDGVNGERSDRTLPRLLSQPIHRDDVINGKFVAGLIAIGLIFTAVTLVVAAIAVLQLGLLPTPEEIARLLVWVVLTTVYVGFWLAFALLCSVVIRRAATSALAAIAVWLVLTLFAALLVSVVAGFVAPLPADPTAGQQIANLSLQQELARLSPSRLYEEATAALLDPTVRTLGLVLPIQADRAVRSFLALDQSLLVIWPQFVSLVAISALAFAAGYVAFMRQEVRA